MSKYNETLLNSLKSTLNSRKIKNFNDEISQQINRLSEIFQKYINQVNSTIFQNKEICLSIDKKITFIQAIITNIINRNYTFKQLKSLEESMNLIKEKNNENKLNLFNEEQNIHIFNEEAKILFKSIKQKYTIKAEEFYTYLSKPSSIGTKNTNSVGKNLKISKNKYTEDNKYRGKYYKINNYNNTTTNVTENNSILDLNEQFAKSTGNKKKIVERNRKIYNCQSQKLFNNTTNSIINKNNLNGKRINLINLNIPMNKNQSIYNIDIRNEVLLNKYFKNDSKINPKDVYKNYIKESNKINNVNNEYEKQIENLNKELIYYKRMANSLYRKKRTMNNNSKDINNSASFIDNKLLNDKLKTKENEIISKDKKIKMLYQKINQYKEQFNNHTFYRNLGSDIDMNINSRNNLSYIKDNYQKYKTESNIQNNIQSNNISIYNNNNMNEIIEKEVYEKYINRINCLEQENNIIKSKLKKINSKYSEKLKHFEKENINFKKEIIELKKKLEIEISKNEDLNKINQDQKILYESELSKINDKRAELTKFLSNKNSEITSLQQEIVAKDKEVENYKSLLSKSKSKINFEEKEKIKQYYTYILKEKEVQQSKLNTQIISLTKQNDILLHLYEKSKKEILDLNNNIKEIKTQFSQQKKESWDTNQLEQTIKKLKDENEGLKEFTLKHQKILLESEQKDLKIKSLQKEKDILKQYFIDMEVPLPSHELCDIKHKNLRQNKEKQKTFESKFTEEECFNILNQLNEAKKEILALKKKNEELFNDLDSHKLKNDYFNHISNDKPIYNYEEEFDLKKMAKGVKEKNRSQDINIDYPGIQEIKEKYRELDFYYNSLEDLVKKLLLCSTCTNKNKTYILELCKIVGFDDDMTNKIVNNKVKKGLLNIFG